MIREVTSTLLSLLRKTTCLHDISLLTLRRMLCNTGFHQKSCSSGALGGEGTEKPRKVGFPVGFLAKE